MTERITFDDWAAVGAPFDHAPAPSHAYVQRDGAWFHEHHHLAMREYKRLGLDMRVDPITARWCAIVAAKS